MRTFFALTLAPVLIVALAAPAAAQVFPPDEDYFRLRCGKRPMRDGRGDAAPHLEERDLVGDVDHAAGFRASDADFLYVRLRLDDDALPDVGSRDFRWGILIDNDDDREDYEILAIVDGLEDEVRLYRNTVTTTRNDALDPADDPPAFTYDLSTHARTDVADTDYGDDDDFFLSFALPWADLEAVGLQRRTRVRIYAASSTEPDRLNGDFACHSSGGYGFTDMDSDRTVSDPDIDSDGDGDTDAVEVEEGSDPDDPDSRPGGGGGGAQQLAGGGGCGVAAGAASGRPSAALAAFLLAAFAAFAFARRRLRRARYDRKESGSIP